MLSPEILGPRIAKSREHGHTCFEVLTSFLHPLLPSPIKVLEHGKMHSVRQKRSINTNGNAFDVWMNPQREELAHVREGALFRAGLTAYTFHLWNYSAGHHTDVSGAETGMVYIGPETYRMPLSADLSAFLIENLWRLSLTDLSDNLQYVS